MIKASIAVSDLGGLRSLAAAEPIKAQTLGACLVQPKRAPLAQPRAEGPDALQVLIKAPMVFPDFGGLQSLAAAEPTEPSTLNAYLVPGQNKPPIVQHGAEGPDALQVLIKAPMVLPAYRGRDRLRPVP